MVIYRHVPNKAAVLNGVAEVALAQSSVDSDRRRIRPARSAIFADRDLSGCRRAFGIPTLLCGIRFDVAVAVSWSVLPSRLRGGRGEGGGEAGEAGEQDLEAAFELGSPVVGGQDGGEAAQQREFPEW